MSTTGTEHRATSWQGRGRPRKLVGSGDRIGLLTLPFLVAGLWLAARYPAAVDVGGPPWAVAVPAAVVLVVGVAAWIWSVVMIREHVPRDELISDGPFAVVRHPLDTSVALLVLPPAGIPLETWVRVVIELVHHVASRACAPAEGSRPRPGVRQPVGELPRVREAAVAVRCRGVTDA